MARTKNPKPVKAPKTRGSSWLVRTFPTFTRALAPEKAPKSGKAPKKGSGLKPTLPTVDLLPPRLELDKLKRSTRRGFIITGVGIVATAAALYSAQIAVIELANQQLSSASTEVAESEAQLSEYGQVKAYYLEIQSRKELLANQAGQKLDFEAIGNLVVTNLPGGASVTGISVSYLTGSLQEGQTDPASECGPVVDPFAQASAPVLACLSFSGTVRDREQLAAFNIALSQSNLLVNVNLVQSEGATSEGSVTFTGTAAVTAAALLNAGNGQPAAPSPEPSPEQSSTPQPRPEENN